MKVIAIAGSLRQQSFNQGLVRAAVDCAPKGMDIEIADISSIPLYNGDVDNDKERPAEVLALAEKLQKADALLIATPEYNYSVPGVLKNTLDWLSRVPGKVFAGKPTAIMGASMGGMGSSRSQYHLRQILVGLDAYLLNKPEVFVSSAHEKCDEQGNLTDDKTQSLIADQLVALQAWSAHFS